MELVLELRPTLLPEPLSRRAATLNRACPEPESRTDREGSLGDTIRAVAGGRPRRVFAALRRLRRAWSTRSSSAGCRGATWTTSCRTCSSRPTRASANCATPAAFGGWMATIARNRATDYLRQIARAGRAARRTAGRRPDRSRNVRRARRDSQAARGLSRHAADAPRRRDERAARLPNGPGLRRRRCASTCTAGMKLLREKLGLRDHEQTITSGDPARGTSRPRRAKRRRARILGIDCGPPIRVERLEPCSAGCGYAGPALHARVEALPGSRTDPAGRRSRVALAHRSARRSSVARRSPPRPRSS